MHEPEGVAAPDLVSAFAAFLDHRTAPLVPAGGACFSVGDGVDHAALHRELLQRLKALRAEQDRNPHANPIQRLAREVLRGLEGGQWTLSAVEQVAQRLTGLAFAARAQRLAAYAGTVDPAANRARLFDLVRGLTRGRGGRLVHFETFRRRVEAERFGIVFTAHPTFGLAGDLVRVLAELAGGHDAEGVPLSPETQQALFVRMIESAHRPDAPLDLARELDLSLEALANAQDALCQVYDVIFQVAEEVYPHDWRSLTPRLVTLASWVGYDLDGRSDILWTDTFNTRLKVQALQLGRYRMRVLALLDRCPPDGCAFGAVLMRLEDRLRVAIREIAEEIDVFQSANLLDMAVRERIRVLAKGMHEGRDRRLIQSEQVAGMVEEAIALAGDSGAARALCVLRAEIANWGLGMAHTHVRLNAIQLHNAVRKAIGLEAPPDDPGHRRSYVAAVEALLDEVTPQTINFGSLLAEKASAKRLTMVVAQMVKYVDASTPVRFLIAECEAGATLLTALYFARLFGIDERVDISPLFETPDAIDHGTQLVAEALSSPHWRAYLRKRGRMCVQTGFSDSGRYLGQTAAGHAIERLRLRLGALLAQYGMTDIQLVVFNTHGESIGRGAHPDSLAERLAYLATPKSRARFDEAGIDVKEEVSFQGGDGYVHFMAPPLAFATVARILDFALVPPADPIDRFYDEADYVAEFFTTVRSFNARVMDDPNYATLLGTWGTNLLHSTGSRPSARQTDGSRAPVSHPSQLRAIPQNAILQQLGMMANTLGGLGEAIARDPERFQRLYQSSARFRQIIALAEYALKYSDIHVLRAYVDSLDPDLWLLEAASTHRRSDVGLFEAIAGHLDDLDVHHRLVRIRRVLQRDHLHLAEHLAYCPMPAADGPGRLAVAEERIDDLCLLHALRIALIHRIFELVPHIPEFSEQRGISRDQIAAAVLRLDITDAVSHLQRIFPKTEDLPAETDFGEEATYRSEWSLSYAQEHERVFMPLIRLHELARRIGTAVSHIIGAVG